MPAKTQRSDSPLIHISQADVEKISLGHGKYLYHISDRFFINDRDGSGKRIWREIPPKQKIFIGEETLEFPAQIFYGEERITLSAQDLLFSKTFRKGLFSRQTRIFCNHLSFRAEPGKLTGIMGPSGAGKTVLLNLLSGYTIHVGQCRDKILINGTYDVHTHRRMLGRTIGYVPQDDTLIPQLTVWKSLESSFELRYSGVEDGVKAYIIRDACRKSGFPESRLDELLPNKIGSPDEKTLSGGERKRVNIAHELIRNPLLLFLDEPTSGLSSLDSDNVISSLKSLCETSRITIIVTIHQPSVKSFEKLDRLLVVNRGGNVAYFGGAKESIAYFEEKSQEPCRPNHNPAEFILEALDNWTTKLAETLPDKEKPDKPRPEDLIAAEYKENPHYFSFEITERTLAQFHAIGLADTVVDTLRSLAGQRFWWRDAFIAKLQETLESPSEDDLKAIVQQTLRTEPILPPADKKRKRVQRLPHLSTSFLQQFWILLRRNHAVAVADTKNRMFQILQPVVIAGLMLLAFAWYAQDYYTENIFSKTGYYFTEQLRQNKTIFLETDLPKAKNWAYSEIGLIGEGAANRQAAIFFLLTASCIWFGIINACREIVAERTLLKREAKSILRIASYLAAKVVFLGWTCCKQSVLLLGVVFLPNGLLWLGARFLPVDTWEPAHAYILPFLLSTRLLPQFSIPYILGVLGILAMTSVLASWVGLTISALAPTQKTALTVVPLIIFPQLLFGGLIRPTKYMEAAQIFSLNQQSFEVLSESMPVETLKQLQALKNQIFMNEDIFLDEVNVRIGYQEMIEFGAVLATAARRPSFFQKIRILPFRLHDLMLQKWAFKALLLYNSLEHPNVLKRELDFDRPLEYQYLQFETIHVSDMFFAIDPAVDSRRGRQTLLQGTVFGMVAWHGIVLLGLTYFWLRRTLLR